MAMARVLLALAFLTVELYPSWFPLTGRSLFYAVMAAYAAAGLTPRMLDARTGSLFRLVVDFIFFLIAAADPPDRGILLTSLFYVFVLLAAALFHDLKEVAGVFALTLVFFLITGREPGPGLWPMLLLPGLVALPLVEQKRMLADRLFTASRQAVMYRSEMEKARESERQRIAGDFHDGPLQSFISFQMRLEIIKKLMARDKPSALDELEQLQALCRTQISDLRSFVRGMRLQDTEGASLAASIHKVVEDFQKTSGLAATLVTGSALGSVDPEFSHEIVSIVREALNNVQKHSRAARVAVAIDRRGDVIEIGVEDDGNGFPFAGSFSLEELERLRLGPGSIKRRVRALSGEMTLESTPGRGAALRIRLAL